MVINPHAGKIVNYPITDCNLPFTEYINKSRIIIQERRLDLDQPKARNELIIDVNSPFEMYPAPAAKPANKLKYGVLMIHGLLDSPFSFQEIAAKLQTKDILCKSILLPGHGTKPDDLLSISCQEWVQALHYGVHNLKKEVDHVFIAGYSTGAALAVLQAFEDKNLSGIILLAPAIHIKAPMYLVHLYHFLKRTFHLKNCDWINRESEINYAKYISIPFNAVKQVALLTDKIKHLRSRHTVHCPIFMCTTYNDETICTRRAMNFFNSYHHTESKLILYSPEKKSYRDARIMLRPSRYPEYKVKDISHISLPFSPNNFHYGQRGDYEFASHINNNKFVYGAYDPINIDIRTLLYKWKIASTKMRTLTYNPDFDFMAEEIATFILKN